jgi:hypothetical protein
MRRMKCDARAVFAALALVLASCQGSGLDSGMGDMSPPVSQPGAMNAGGINSGGPNGLNGGMNGNNNMSGPQVGMNGQEELANPGATLAPNEAQYPISQGPSGMKCPNVQLFNQQYTCNLAFNIPAPSPSPSGSPGATPKPTASPTPSPSPTASSDDSDDDDDTPSPSPSPGGMITLLTEPLPKDVPSMVNPNSLFLRITPLMALRLQSNTDFALNGGTTLQYTLPAMQFSGRVFALQLFNETSVRGKRTDQIIGNYAKWTAPTSTSNTVQFTFNVPKVTVRHTQVWLLALYGAQLPPGSTPTPSPSPPPTTAPSSSP